MRYAIFPLRPGKLGRKKGEFPLGAVEWREEGVVFEIPDRGLLSRLRKHFAESYTVRFFAGNDNVMAHDLKVVSPPSQAHFEEALRRIVRLDLLPVAED